MESNNMWLDQLGSLSIDNLGSATIKSKLKLDKDVFVNVDRKVLLYSSSVFFKEKGDTISDQPVFEVAGPRNKLFFEPKTTVCAIVTCGGLCPGINDVIRTITLTALSLYKVKSVLGFCYGYQGMAKKPMKKPMVLTQEIVKGIQHKGGSILGVSRGAPSVKERVDALVKNKINILFVIGGDGTFAGAHEMVQEITRRKLKISVVGVPKTIDNDIVCSELTFGFGTSVEKARESIAAAHDEATSAHNGIGLVKVMGRDSGFIAMRSSLSNSDVNFCLIPEKEVILKGKEGLLPKLEKRLAKKKHAVIVVAEGAGQNLVKSEKLNKDKSGNVLHNDIGVFLKGKIQEYFQDKKIPVTLKYIDPSYTIRSCPANARDSSFCLFLGQMAVHAAMAGKTDMFIGYWNQHYTNVPFEAAVGKRKKVNLKGRSWQLLSVLLER